MKTELKSGCTCNIQRIYVLVVPLWYPFTNLISYLITPKIAIQCTIDSSKTLLSSFVAVSRLIQLYQEIHTIGLNISVKVTQHKSAWIMTNLSDMVAEGCKTMFYLLVLRTLFVDFWKFNYRFIKYFTPIKIIWHTSVFTSLRGLLSI